MSQDAASVGGVGEQATVVVKLQEVELLKRQVAKLEERNEIVKVMAREGQKKGELAKHKSPQIKRSLGMLMDVEWGLQDSVELLESLTDFPVCSENAELYMEKLPEVKDKLTNLKDLVSNEITANKIASKANFGWKTVKHFENDSLFQGENADALSKKLKSAEFQASRELFRGRGRGLKRKFPYKSRWDSPPSTSTSAFHQQQQQPSVPPKLCYKCDKPGHFRDKCPN